MFIRTKAGNLLDVSSRLIAMRKESGAPESWAIVSGGVTLSTGTEDECKAYMAWLEVRLGAWSYSDGPLGFGDSRDSMLDWLNRYVVNEDYSHEHLDAIMHIVGLFNDCEDAEQEVFEFAEKLYKRYAA